MQTTSMLSIAQVRLDIQLLTRYWSPDRSGLPDILTSIPVVAEDLHRQVTDVLHTMLSESELDLNLDGLG